VTYIDTLAMRVDFCIGFYTAVKQENIHFNTNFVKILKATKAFCFNQDDPLHFSAFLH